MHCVHMQSQINSFTNTWLQHPKEAVCSKYLTEKRNVSEADVEIDGRPLHIISSVQALRREWRAEPEQKA